MESKYVAVLVIIAIALTGIITALSISSTQQEEPTPIQNQTPPVVPPVPDPIVCGNGTHLNNGTCVADPVIPPDCGIGELYNTTSQVCEKPPVIPQPQPVDNITRKVIAVGDFDCADLLDPVKSRNPTLVLGLGDYCYDKTLTPFTSTWGTLGNLLKCVIGNHESKENAESQKVIDETLAYCKDNQYVKHGKSIFFLINTNGNLPTQQAAAIKLLSNQTFMEPFKNVFLISHKPVENLEDSHHGVEAKVAAFGKAFNDAVPTGLQEFYIAAHDHNMAYGVNAEGDKFFISGGGGADRYPCGEVSGIWKMCNDKNYGWVEFTITPDGTVTHNFYNIKGQVVN